MSSKRFTKIKCPFCDTEQDFEYYSSVNVTMSPDLKHTAMKGELNLKECNNCQKEINVVSGFLYHDMEKKLMINFKTTDEESDFENSDITEELKTQGYIFRIVNSIPDLAEKILIFDNNLNDKVISDFKNNFIKILPDLEGVKMNLIFKKIDKGFFSTKIVFAFFSHVDQIMEFKIGTKKLSQSQRQDLFNLDILRNQGWLFVDNYSTS